MFTVITSLPLDEAIMHARMWVNKTEGYVLTSSDAKSLSYTRTIRPNIAIVILLLLLWVLPGILYLIFAWKKETRNLFFKELPDNKVQIQFDAGTRTKEYSQYMVKYFRSIDPDLEILEAKK